MGNAARKARKREGIKFTKPQKVGTPPINRNIDVVKRERSGATVIDISNRKAKKIYERLFGGMKKEDQAR